MATSAGLLSVFCFALNDLLYRVLSPQMGVWPLMLIVNVGLFLLVAAWSICKKTSLLSLKSPLWVGGWILCSLVIQVFALLSFRFLTVSQAYLVIFSYPILTAALDAFYKRSFPKRYIAAFALAGLGIALVFGTRGMVLSFGVCAAGIVAAAIAVQIFIAARMPEESPLKITGLAALAGVFLALGGGMLSGKGGDVKSELWPALGGLLAVSIVGNITRITASQKMSSARYALMCYLQVPLGVGLAWLFLKEEVSLRVGAGVALVLIGSFFSQKRRKLKPTKNLASAE